MCNILGKIRNCVSDLSALCNMLYFTRISAFSKSCLNNFPLAICISIAYIWMNNFYAASQRPITIAKQLSNILSLKLAMFSVGSSYLDKITSEMALAKMLLEDSLIFLSNAFLD